MSVTISISLHIDPANIINEYIALVKRFNIHNNLQKVEIGVRDWHDELVVLPNDLPIQELYVLPTSIHNSNKALRLSFSYELLSGQRLGLDLQLYGVDFWSGYHYRVSGPLELTLSHNDLARSLKDWIREGGDHNSSEAVQMERDVRADAEELFLRACGLFSDIEGCPDIKHGAMYLELGWASPVGCSMVYHQQPQDFIVDFWRIYAEYNWGTWMTQTFETGLEHWRDNPSPSRLLKNKPGRDKPEFYQQFAGPDEQEILFQFLDNLTENKVQKFSQVSENEVREILSEMSLYVPDVEFYDFDKCGLAVATYPLLSVWHSYKYIADRLSGAA